MIMKKLKYIILTAIFLVTLNHCLNAQVQKGETAISGFVYESATGKPVSGAMVTIPNVISTITADDGSFKIQKSIKGAYLIVNAPGFADKQVRIFGDKPLKIYMLDESFKGKYEDVTLPTESENLRQTSVALSSHENRDDYSLATSNIETVLQGNMNGMNTLMRSGVPGAGANMFINGFNSINSNTQPLIVIDGVAYDNQPIYSMIGGNIVTPLSDLDIKDIDNITVLKDGASIYGSKAANGVVLIRTLRAKEMATRINFYSYAGLNLEPNTKYRMMDGWSYKSYLFDMLSSKGLSANEIQSLPYINSEVPVVEKWGVSGNPDYYRYNQSTDWQDEVFARSLNQNYHLNVTGGNDIALYAISFGYLNHGGMVDNTSFSRYSTRANAEIKMTDWFKLNANMSFIYTERNLSFEGNDRNFNPLLSGLVKAPFMSPYVYNVLGEKTPNLEDDDVFNISNPLAIINNALATNERFRFFGIMNGTISFSKYLQGNIIFGLTTDKVSERVFMPEDGVFHTSLPSAEITNESEQLRNQLMQVNAEASLSYRKSFSNMHDLKANAGFRFQSSSAQLDWGEAFNTSSDEMKTLGDGMNELAKIGGSIGNWRSVSNYFNAEYGYLKKYYLSVNAALDGSSRFGKKADGLKIGDNVFGFFPSVNGAWLVSSEDFMSGIKFMDFLKLRAGYSITGNDDIGNYTARKYYTSQEMLGAFGLVRGNIPNPSLKWETNKKTSAGFDASFMNERLNVSLDLYSSATSDLIRLENAGTNSGIGFAVMNDGKMSNKGIDLNLNGRLIDAKEFKWDMGLQISTYKNKIVSMSEDETLTEIEGGIVRTKVGEPVAQFYGYKTDGVFSTLEDASASGLKIVKVDGSEVPFTAGDMKFVDKDGNKIIDEKDMRVIGDPNPDFFGSVTSKLIWKRFTLNTLFTYSVGNDIYNSLRANLESMSGTDNQTLVAIYRWKHEGQKTDTPKAVWCDPMGNSRFSDRWIEDGSYLRLKSITLAYDIAMRNKFVNSAQVYVTGSNLLTFTKYLGYDPECSTGQSPLYLGIDEGFSAQPRTVSVGIRIGL